MNITTIESPNAEWSSVQPVISFDDLEIEIQADENADEPWASQDGLEHRVITHGGELAAMDYIEHSGYFSNHSDYGVIELDLENYANKVGEDRPTYGTEKFLHARGCSKQAAFEAEKQNEKRTREQIARWYSEGFEAFGVVVKLNGEHVESCWGFYGGDEDYAKQSVAQSAVATLEAQGYIVRDIPEWVNGKPGRRMLPGNVHWFDFGNKDGERHEFNPAKRDRKPLNLP